MYVNAPDNTFLVSVIVPIFNVAPWLRKCLDSLKHQTLKQIEVIMVEDGSTDGSGEIAEEYVSDEWPVFRLVRHGKNKGLSAARNTGIDEARSGWTMFVDSDDWVDESFCEIPYKAAVENGADMVIFDFTIWKNPKEKKKTNRKNITVSGFVDEKKLFENRETSVWNKLYKKELFDSIRYPEGRVYEEVAITHKLIHKAQKIFYLEDCLYNYLIRENSITRTDSIMNRKDLLISVIERNKDFLSYGYKIDVVITCSAAISYLAKQYNCNDELCQIAGQMLDLIKLMPCSISFKQKIAFMAWKVDKRLFYKLCCLRERIDAK